MWRIKYFPSYSFENMVMGWSAKILPTTHSFPPPSYRLWLDYHHNEIIITKLLYSSSRSPFTVVGAPISVTLLSVPVDCR